MKFLLLVCMMATLTFGANRIEKIPSSKLDTLHVPKIDTMLVVRKHKYEVTNIWKDTVKLLSTGIDSSISYDTLTEVKRIKISKSKKHTDSTKVIKTSKAVK
jgi:hypothetical protein